MYCVCMSALLYCSAVRCQVLSPCVCALCAVCSLYYAPLLSSPLLLAPPIPSHAYNVLQCPVPAMVLVLILYLVLLIMYRH